MNRQDHSKRQFLVVQLPEPTEDKRYPTIAEIGKARIRNVIHRLESDGTSLGFSGDSSVEDLGFKVFKLAEPNIQQWPIDEDSDPESYTQKLSLFNDPLIPGWKPENVIWEVALREGFSLNTRFTAKDLANGNKVHEVTDPDTGQRFLICLDDQIRADFAKHCELAPDSLLICRDVALDDSAAANLALQCRLKTI